jgi:hypothetical protein
MAAVLGRSIQHGLKTVGGDRTKVGEVYMGDNSRGCLKSTFAPYYVVTIALNSLAIFAGIVSQLDFHRNQHNYSRFQSTDAYFLANGAFAGIHIMACLYIVHAIERPAQKKTTLSLDGKNESTGFDYSNLDGTVDVPPPPRNPNYIQAHEVVVVPMDRSRTLPFSSEVEPEPAEPLTWSRIVYVLKEDKAVAIYIVVFAIYAIFHYYMDYSHVSYLYYPGLHFTMKIADIFILAGPASLAFSIGYTLVMHQRNK